MQKRLKEEELKILRGEHEGDHGDPGDMNINISGKGGVGKSEGNVYGSMSGGSDSDSDMSEVLDSDNSGAINSSQGSDADDLIDDDDDNNSDDALSMISGESPSHSSLS